MRLIDADALIEYLKDETCKINSFMEDALQIEAFAIRANLKAQKSKLEDIICDIENGPSIDAVPVKHGRWIEEPNCMYRCSNCGDHYPSIRGYMYYDYCPSCGARMDERKESCIQEQ